MPHSPDRLGTTLPGLIQFYLSVHSANLSSMVFKHLLCMLSPRSGISC